MSQGVIVAIIGVVAAISAALITGIFELLKNKKPKKSLRDKEADSLIKTNEHISGINQHLCEQMKILTERMDSQEIKLQNQTNRIEVLATDNFSFKSKIKELEEQNTRLRSQIQNIINDNEIKDEEHKKVILSLERKIVELESENLSLKEENKRLQSLIDMLEKRTQEIESFHISNILFNNKLICSVRVKSSILTKNTSL